MSFIENSRNKPLLESHRRRYWVELTNRSGLLTGSKSQGNGGRGIGQKRTPPLGAKVRST